MAESASAGASGGRSTEKRLFSNANILSWLQYYAQNMDVDLEKVKILDITRKNKNLIPMVESHRAVLVFTEAGHADIFYRMWDAGLGEPQPKTVFGRSRSWRASPLAEERMLVRGEWWYSEMLFLALAPAYGILEEHEQFNDI